MIRSNARCRVKRQVFPVQGLFQVVERPLFHRLNGGIDRAVGGHDDYALLRVQAKHIFEKLHTGHPLHLQIGQDQVEFLQT